MPWSPRYPRPLQPGSLIAVTAPSSGVPAPLHPRLDLVIEQLRVRGYRVREGRCLRQEHKNASASREARAAELMSLLLDDEVDAVFPPWGGERAIELLPLLDFAALERAEPTWLMGYSDLSTLMLPLTLRCGWATVHGPNLMDLPPGQDDALTAHALDPLVAGAGADFDQRQSPMWQKHWEDFALNPRCTYRLTEPTRWRPLSDAPAGGITMSGRLIGGCLDTLMHLAGAPFGDVPGFVRRCGDDGAIVYLENADMGPADLLRALWSVRLSGWFDNVRGVLIGRSNGPEAKAETDLQSDDALQAVLGDLPCPVLVDVDIGHRPPQLTLVNGALAELRWSAALGGELRQRLR
jgi:muramoyltetrapeptide carboxypeptidase